MFWWRHTVGDIGIAFTDVQAGNLALHAGGDLSSAQHNRDRLEADLGLDAGSLRFMNQLHTADVAMVDEHAEGSATGGPDVATADALISPGGTAPMAVLAADCMPIVLAGTAAREQAGASPHMAGSRQVISTAVVHAGRRGLLAGVLPSAVAAMRTLGEQRLQAWIGPSICGSCYEVPAQMAAEAAELLPAAAAATRWGTPGLDLQAGAAAQLKSLGVRYEFAGGCTLEEHALFSHRRQSAGSSTGVGGRFAGLVWRNAGTAA